MHLFTNALKLLTFRLSRKEILSFTSKDFITGLLGTWVVGMGRYWDDDGASLLQHMGLGSVIYIFTLSFLIWLIIKPFLVEGWSYFIVLTFISLTSFPAIFYAIPVERFFPIETANTINVWFLAVVATWRLALLYYFLKVFTKMKPGRIIVVTLMPICFIITALTILNLHRVVFDIMGGRRDTGPHDGAYGVLIFLTVVSALLIVPLLVIYFLGISERHRPQNK